MTGGDDVIVASAVRVYIAIAKGHHVLQNDTHMFNVMLRLDDRQLQAIDFERASLLQNPQHEWVWNHLKTFHMEYCTRFCRRQGPESDGITQLMMWQVTSCGLDNTHAYFSRLYKSGSFRNTSFNEDAFVKSPVTEWKYCAWLHLLHHFYSEGLSPILEAVAGSASTEFIISFATVTGTFHADNHCCHVRFTAEYNEISHEVDVCITACVQGTKDPHDIGVDRFRISSATGNPWQLADFDTTQRFVTTALALFLEDRVKPAVVADTVYSREV